MFLRGNRFFIAHYQALPLRQGCAAPPVKSCEKVSAAGQCADFGHSGRACDGSDGAYGREAFEFCVFDPEGDYDDLENSVSIGDVKLPPKPEEAIKLLRVLGAPMLSSILKICTSERPSFLQSSCRKWPPCGSSRRNSGFLLTRECQTATWNLFLDLVAHVPYALCTPTFFGMCPEPVCQASSPCKIRRKFPLWNSQLCQNIMTEII